jgi:tetratricopeptide (TPR) repeat protein
MAAAQLEELLEAEPEDPEAELQLAYLYSAEKHYRRAIEKFSAVLEEQPENAAALRGRADVLLSVGRQAEAIADYEKMLALEPDDSHVLNNLAWVLATSPDEKLRDGKRAIELATKACELTKYKEAHILSTLGAGYAETGDFQTAIQWSQKAVELAGEEQLEALNKELESYRADQPVRELMTEPEEPGESEPDKPEEPEPSPSKEPQPETALPPSDAAPEAEPN